MKYQITIDVEASNEDVVHTIAKRCTGLVRSYSSINAEAVGYKIEKAGDCTCKTCNYGGENFIGPYVLCCNQEVTCEPLKVPQNETCDKWTPLESNQHG